MKLCKKLEKISNDLTNKIIDGAPNQEIEALVKESIKIMNENKEEK